MKIKAIISLLFIIATTGLYFLGACEWDLASYILCVIVAILFMMIFIKQQKKYDELNERHASLELELKQKASK